ncbi:hypothetical protein WAK64_12735 [Bacillus spongiae]|uniref:Fibronectin type-III domain-containing protein n=1 Tax=Bacillus spongiae TaxID=2683610 RepID=A0ABU8HF58_9BACI
MNNVIFANKLSYFIFSTLIVLLLIPMNVFAQSDSEVDAPEGYEGIDRGTYEVYIPEDQVESNTTKSLPKSSFRLLEAEEKSSNNGYVEPDLFVPALEENEAFPVDTYENRTIFHGIDPEQYIPINFIVDAGKRDHYYNADYYEELAGQPLSVLNNALDKYDPDIDTFRAVYSPSSGLLNSTFPLGTPQEITLLLDKNSYFAEGLTLDIEEWWERDRYGIEKTGGTTNVSYDRSWGLSEEQQEEAALTHGFGLGTSFEYTNDTLIAGEFTVGVTLEYTYEDSRTFAFARSVEESNSRALDKTFGEKAGSSPYKWAVYNLVTQSKVNYNSGKNFHELTKAFENDLDDYGLRPDKNSYNVQMVNEIYATMEVPMYEKDPNLEVPTNVQADSSFKELTTNLSWDPVSDPNVHGYIVYKNDSVAAYIQDPTVTSWLDVNVEPNKSNEYWIESYHESNLFNSETLYKTVSLQSEKVDETVELNAASLKDIVQTTCSIPFSWEDDQLPAGERTYYRVYVGNPDTDGEEVGIYEGTDAAVNISSELYDLLVENQNKDYYIVKEVLYNDRLIKSPSSKIANNFTVTDTAFLFSKTGFNGECISVSEGQNVADVTSLDFPDNQLSSLLVRGDVYVTLSKDKNYDGLSQTIFGNATFRDLDSKEIRANTVSSLKVKEKKDGVYLFSGSNYMGDLKFKSRSSDGISSFNDISADIGFANNDLSSVKTVGPYALVTYEDKDYGGEVSWFNEGGDKTLDDRDIGDNTTSSIKVIRGEGVHLFRKVNFKGDHIVSKNFNCGNITKCNGGLPNDTLSSVIVIGDYGVALFKHTNYEGNMSSYKDGTKDLRGSNVGNDSVSSYKVFGKGVYLFKDKNYNPNNTYVKITSPGEFSTTEELGLTEGTLSSIFIVGDFKATLYTRTNFGGTSQLFTVSDKDLSNNTVGDNTVKSLIVEEK